MWEELSRTGLNRGFYLSQYELSFLNSNVATWQNRSYPSNSPMAISRNSSFFMISDTISDK